MPVEKTEYIYVWEDVPAGHPNSTGRMTRERVAYYLRAARSRRDTIERFFNQHGNGRGYRIGALTLKPRSPAVRYPTRAHHVMANGTGDPVWLAITAAEVVECGHERKRFEAKDGSAIIVTPDWWSLGVHKDRLGTVATRIGYGAITHALAVDRHPDLRPEDALPA